MSFLLLALLAQVGADPMRGGLPNDDLVRDRPPRREAPASDLPEAENGWLADCLGQLDSDAARAHTMAQIRRSETTGADRVLANHCLGTAASALERWADARSAFAAARAETPENEPRARSRFAALAGAAALAEGDAAGAADLLALAEADARAAGSAPLEAIAATDRARALVSLKRADEALAALEIATTRAPERSEGWLLKATLLRRLDRLEEAQTAIERASALAPGAAGLGPEIGLEAGLIAALAGRDDAARASWQSVIDLSPKSPSAATARDYLDQLRPPVTLPESGQ